MSVKITKLPGSEAEILGELPAEVFESHYVPALQKVGEDVEIPGFRKGKAPESVLLSHVGEMKVLEEMAQAALSEEYPKILEREKLDAIGAPMITITKLARRNPLGFKIRTALLPEVKLPDYKKIARGIKSEIEKEEKPTSEEEKNKASEKTRLKIIERIIEESKIELPALLAELELDKILHKMEADISAMGLKFEDYLAHIKKTREDLRKELRPDAEKKAKFSLILAEIAKVEKLEPSKEEVDREVAHILEHYKDADPVRARMHAENVLANEKVFVLLESA
ncbi:MAG: trigger factor [Patescibacteria group bacterium]